MPDKTSHVLILGAGYLGLALADRLASEGRKVVAVSRSDPRAGSRDPTDRTWQWMHGDVTRRHTLDRLPFSPIVVVCVGHQRGGRTSPDAVHRIGIRNLLGVVAEWPSVPHLVLVSTTGVYSQTGGVWVDERSVTRPNRESAWAHLRGEDVLRQRHPSERSTILRMSGLYGPGRLPQMQRLVRGEPVAADPNTYLNLVHRDDAVAAMRAAVQRRVAGLFCVSDDTPVLRGDYYRELARSVDAPPPTFESSDRPGSGPDRRRTNRRVDNRRLKRSLLPALRYPRTIEGIVRTIREN